MQKIICLLIFLLIGMTSVKAIDLPDLPDDENVQKISNQPVAVKTVSQYDFGVDYDTAITMDKPVVLMFYTNWCSACKRAVPLVKAQQKKYGEDFVFTSLNAEDTKYSAIIKDYRLRCFPTLYIIDPKYNNRVHIEVSYLFNATALSTELDRYLSIRKKLDLAENIKKLIETSFEGK